MKRLLLAIVTFAACAHLASGTVSAQIFTLVNADTDADISVLTTNSQIDLSSSPTQNLNIRFDPATSVANVSFSLSGSQSHTTTEGVAPYALYGDTNGDYNAHVFTVGNYSLTATPSTGSPSTITFSVVNGGGPSSTPAPSSNPTPVPGAGDSWQRPTLDACRPAARPGISAQIAGEQRKWHTISLLFNAASSMSEEPATFLHNRLDVELTHPATGKTYLVPGHFAADGNAAETSEDFGNLWRAHFTPDEPGEWQYIASFRTGSNVAGDTNPCVGTPDTAISGVSGSFTVLDTNKQAPDLRAKGRLAYVGKRYLQFQETGEYFIKGGPDAPENTLAYNDFDNTDFNPALIKSWQPHASDYVGGGQTWKNGKGTELMGMIDYLASEGLNAFSFLTMNINGDDKNVYPYLSSSQRTTFDVSKLDQWERIFAYGEMRGMYLHFKMSEEENTALLDGGTLGPERRAYYRELVSRFGHHLALNWNLSEEITVNNTDEQVHAWAGYIRKIDPYHHNIVFHTYPEQLNLYNAHLGEIDDISGVSLQTEWYNVHTNTLRFVRDSSTNNFPWIVANDEQQPYYWGVPPDGNTAANYTIHDIRHQTLWGNLMAGGAGVEYYYGYNLPCNDLDCQDHRSRDQSWDYVRHAINFFSARHVPFWEMEPDDSAAYSGSTNIYAMRKNSSVWLIYIPDGQSVTINNMPAGNYNLRWYDPRNGGALIQGNRDTLNGGADTGTGDAPNSVGSDWVAVIKATSEPTIYPAPDVIDAYYMYQQTSPPPEQNPSDLDDDGDVDFADYWQMLTDFAQHSIFDLSALISRFGS